MKSIHKILLCLSALAFGACSDFLDKYPTVDMASETYYLTESECNAAIMGLYSIPNNGSWEDGPFLWFGDNASDNTTIGNSKSEGYSFHGVAGTQIENFDILTNNNKLNDCWRQGFRGANAATQAIVRIGENKDIPETKKEQYLGEAHYMRGFFNFFMTQQYGRLPIIDHILTYDEYYMSRGTIEETWAHIESDFKMAAQSLPEKDKYSASDRGRATKGAANAMLGKAYIYQGKFQEAYDVLRIVEASGKYQLEPDYGDIYNVLNRNGIESVYEIQHHTSNQGWGDANRGNVLAFFDHDADPDDPVKWHNGWSLHCPTQDLVDSFEPGDPRLAATVIFPGEFFDGRIHKNIASSTGYQPKKWYVPYDYRSQIDQSDTPRNHITYRYADVILFLAEAANEIGKTAEALAYLEQVRGRARSSSSDPDALPVITETNKEGLRELIWKERRSEFACEGQRFWDLARQGRAGKVMRAYAEKYNTLKGKNFIDGKNEIFPIPLSEITASNGGLVQNPGYD